MISENVSATVLGPGLQSREHEDLEDKSAKPQNGKVQSTPRLNQDLEDKSAKPQNGKVQSTPRLNPNVLIYADNQLVDAVVKISDCGFRGVPNPSESTAVLSRVSYYFLIYNKLYKK